MAIEITARHVEVGEEMKEHARVRAQQLMDEYPRVENVHVILDHVRYQYTAEVVVQAKNHVRVEASDSNEILLTAIDSAMSKTDKQLRKARSRVQEHRG